MSIVVSRSSGALAMTTSFQALASVAGASVSSSFNVPTGVSAVKQFSISTAADGAGEEFLCLVKLSGSSLKDGDAVLLYCRTKHNGNQYRIKHCIHAI